MLNRNDEEIEVVKGNYDEHEIRYANVYFGNKIISEKEIKNLRTVCDAMVKAMKVVVEVIKKFWEDIKRFMDANSWITTLGLNKIKFNKRAANRNKLYIKRRGFGRKL